MDASLRARIADLLGDDVLAPKQPPRRRRLPVARALAQCPRGEVMAARDGELDVAVVVLEDGRGFVVPDACPHDGGLLSDGFVESDRLVCSRHGWEFEPETGACIGRKGVSVASRACPRAEACRSTAEPRS